MGLLQYFNWFDYRNIIITVVYNVIVREKVTGVYLLTLQDGECENLSTS